ncbi:unnamed protein product [Adineta steineri]|uniref:Uncharacterized protein n=1 Tax=Adineta steineri TaxID=433720 RepID=A0A814JR02_9BILA|nr:unnamed protein product [Adineta steineri]CAF1320964.1 unnamed protein product [Adineta steineri]
MSDFDLFQNNLFLSIVSINLIPIIIIFLLNSIILVRRYQLLLIIFLSFASGGLLADVFIRLFPSTIDLYNKSNENENQFHIDHQHNNHAGLFILTGILLSFTIEKFHRYFQNNNEQISTSTPIHILAYLFLLADILHKYTNNLSLFSILLSKSLIHSTLLIISIIYETLYVFYGYAILIHSGWTSSKIIRYQLLAGFINSILFWFDLQFSLNIKLRLRLYQIFLPILAGILIYISTVHIMPKVIENIYGIKGTILKVNTFVISVLIVVYLKQSNK